MDRYAKLQDATSKLPCGVAFPPLKRARVGIHTFREAVLLRRQAEFRSLAQTQELLRMHEAGELPLARPEDPPAAAAEMEVDAGVHEAEAPREGAPAGESSSSPYPPG